MHGKTRSTFVILTMISANPAFANVHGLLYSVYSINKFFLLHESKCLLNSLAFRNEVVCFICLCLIHHFRLFSKWRQKLQNIWIFIGLRMKARNNLNTKINMNKYNLVVHRNLFKISKLVYFIVFYLFNKFNDIINTNS